MPTPFSAHDDARPHSRREILRGLALSPVAIAAGAGTGAMIAKASEASPDAELIALCEQWQVARRASDAAWDHSSELEDAAKDAYPMPEALLVRESDGNLPRWFSYLRADGRRWYPPDQLPTLRNLTAPEMPSGQNPRIRELVAVHDEWAAQREQVRKDAGAIEALDRCNETDAECTELARRLAPMQVRILQGVLTKAAVAVALNCGAEELEADVADLLETSEVISNEVLAFVVLRDLNRLGEGT